jgi:hypothetical protein
MAASRISASDASADAGDLEAGMIGEGRLGMRAGFRLSAAEQHAVGFASVLIWRMRMM